MSFAKFCKNISVIVFLLSFGIAFLIANRFSTSDDTFIIVLITNWVISGLLCMFLYGLGVVIEYLHRINNGFREVLKDQQKITPVPEPRTDSDGRQ